MFPADPQAHVIRAPEVQMYATAAAAANACQGSVLVVDDYVDACDVLRRLVEWMGYDAKCVHSGEAALWGLRVRPCCSLMLLDLMMPGMSGFDVLRELRDDPTLPRVPVVVCSAAE